MDIDMNIDNFQKLYILVLQCTNIVVKKKITEQNFALIPEHRETNTNSEKQFIKKRSSKQIETHIYS